MPTANSRPSRPQGARTRTTSPFKSIKKNHGSSSSRDGGSRPQRNAEGGSSSRSGSRPARSNSAGGYSSRNGARPERSGGGSYPRSNGPRSERSGGGYRGGGSSRPQRSGGGRPQRGGSGGGGRGGRKMATFDPSKFINTNPVKLKEAVYEPKHTFATFGFDTRITDTLTAMDITIPSPIQDQIIPEILSGKDVIGLAETGTGKTAAFLAPLIDRTLKDENQQTLILAPTRELAIQIDDELRKIARGMRMFSTVCVGGTSIRPQIRGLQKPNQFIIGTPGRILDLINRGIFKPEQITNVVLDEADRMLDMGFIHDMRKILSSTPKDRSTLFFSATMSPEAQKIVNDFLKDPVTISVKKQDVTNSIEQDIVPHGHHDKFETLVKLLAQPEFRRVIIFGSMKHSVEKLSKELIDRGFKAESIHGNKSHGQRQRALKNIKSGQAGILVATDVAARGIHVDDVTHVINYDLPTTFEDYVHRIGRTGRGDRHGKALTFVPTR